MNLIQLPFVSNEFEQVCYFHFVRFKHFILTTNFIFWSKENLTDDDVNRCDEIEQENNVTLAALLRNNSFNNDELNAIFLTLFCNVKLTQSGFEEILETIKLVSNLEFPSTSFNSCANKILQGFYEKINYTKQWYCVSC